MSAFDTAGVSTAAPKQFNHSQVEELFDNSKGGSVAYKGWGNTTGGVLLSFFQANVTDLVRNLPKARYKTSPTLPIQEVGWDPIGFRNKAQRSLNLSSRGLDGIYADNLPKPFIAQIKKVTRALLSNAEGNIYQDGDFADVALDKLVHLFTVKGPRMDVRGTVAKHFDKRQIKQLFSLYFNKLMTDHENGVELSILCPIGGANYGIPDMLNTYIRCLAIRAFLDRTGGNTPIREISVIDGGDDNAYYRVMTSLLSAVSLFDDVSAVPEEYKFSSKEVQDSNRRGSFLLSEGPAFPKAKLSFTGPTYFFPPASTLAVEDKGSLIKAKLAEILSRLDARGARDRDRTIGPKEAAANELIDLLIKRWFAGYSADRPLGDTLLMDRAFNSGAILSGLDISPYCPMSKYHQDIITELNRVSNLAKAFHQSMPDTTPSAPAAPAAGAGAAATPERPERHVVKDWATHAVELNRSWNVRKDSSDDYAQGVVRCGKSAGELAKADATNKLAVILDELSDRTLESLGISLQAMNMIRQLADGANNNHTHVSIEIPERNLVFVIMPKDYRHGKEYNNPLQARSALYTALELAAQKGAESVIHQCAADLVPDALASVILHRTQAVNAFIEKKAGVDLTKVIQVIEPTKENAYMVSHLSEAMGSDNVGCFRTLPMSANRYFSLSGPFKFNEAQMSQTLGLTREQLLEDADALYGDLRRTTKNKDRVWLDTVAKRRADYPPIDEAKAADVVLATAPEAMAHSGISPLSVGDLSHKPQVKASLTEAMEEKHYEQEAGAVAVRGAGSHRGLTTWSMQRSVDSRSAVEGTMYRDGDGGKQHQYLLEAAKATLPPAKKDAFDNGHYQGSVMLIPHGTHRGVPMFYLAIVPYDKAHSAGNVTTPADFIAELRLEYKRALNGLYVLANQQGKVHCRMPLIACGNNAPVAMYESLFGKDGKQQIINDAYEALLRAVEDMPADFAEKIQVDPIEFNPHSVNNIGPFTGCERSASARDARAIRSTGLSIDTSKIMADEQLHIVEPAALVRQLAAKYSGHHGKHMGALKEATNAADARVEVGACGDLNPKGHMHVIDQVVGAWEALDAMRAAHRAARHDAPPAVAPRPFETAATVRAVPAPPPTAMDRPL